MIYGKRIRLRALEREDLPRFVAWFNDNEVTAGLSVFLPMSQDEEEQWYEGMLKIAPTEHPMMIEIRSDETWIPIGDCGFHKIDWRNQAAELGIVIGEKSYWNQGYGTEAMRLLLRHGFNTLNLNRIFLRVFESNPRAIRTYEKAGFVHEGCFRQAEYRNGRYVDVLFMSVLRSEWKDGL
jgi:diamine N-acetyltransferase